MGIFVNFLVFLLIAITYECESTSRRQRRPQLSGIARKLKQSGGFSAFFSNRNLFESNACVHHLCYNVTNYPIVDVNTIIKKRKEFHKLFGSVIEPYSPPEILEKAPVYDAMEDQNMCPVLRYRLCPQTALSLTMKRVVIVNVENFKQVVSFEVCVPNRKCFMDDHKPLFYETFCKQQYTLIRLVTVTESGDLMLDNIPIPSSCVCSYKRIV